MCLGKPIEPVGCADDALALLETDQRSAKGLDGRFAPLADEVFHADDPHLGPPPWFDVRWSHAGGGDSEFQAKWPDHLKVRPAFSHARRTPWRRTSGLSSASEP